MEQRREKVRENRMRRVAARRGLHLEKSRGRDPGALGYGGYMIVDVAGNYVVAGASPYGFALDLDGVEKYLG